MKAALLCPGPSLSRTWRGRDGYELVIGVNRAACFAECDWWVFGDQHIFKLHRPLGMPAIFICDNALKHIGSDGDRLMLHRVRRFSENTFPNPSNWNRYSATAAVTLARDLGVTDLDCYGCDWTNEPDWDGHSHPKDKRHDRRWAEERKIWDGVTKGLGWKRVLALDSDAIAII